MKTRILFAALLASAAVPAYAQDTNTSTSGSGAEANSGSISGASSDGNQQGQQQNNLGIGSSTSESNSGAVSGSASESESLSFSDQGQAQTQGQSANNDQGQTQGQNANNAQAQEQGLTNTNQLGATNSQGVAVSNTFNTTGFRRTYVGTNAAVPLAASSSFSSDYCGGTASVGASAAPIGISVGGNKPVFDESCQYLRRAEKFGMAAANYWNMQQPEEGLKLMSLMVWSICMADVRNDSPTPTELACMQLLGNTEGSPATPPAVYVAPPVQPEVTPEYVAPNADSTYSDVPPEGDLYKTPRGDADTGDSDPLAELTERRAEPIASVDPTLFAASAPRMP